MGISKQKYDKMFKNKHMTINAEPKVGKWCIRRVKIEQQYFCVIDTKTLS